MNDRFGGLARRAPGLLLVLAGLAIAGPGQAAERDGHPFALVPPDKVAALAHAPDSPIRTQAIHSADRFIDRAPHAMATIHVEGTLPHQGIYDESREAIRDFSAASELALAGRLTGDPRYTDRATAILSAWITTYRSNFNPIDETLMDWLLIANDLLPDSARAPLAPAMNRFMRSMAEGYLERLPTLTGNTAINNWQSHRIKLITLAAYGLGDPRLIAQAKAAFRAQIAANILADGSTEDFADRDAVHYAAYDLQGLDEAAMAAKQHGDDWYHLKNPAGSSLESAMLWLLPYAEGVKTHKEFEHSNVKFDAQRRDAGLAEFNGSLDPKDTGDAIEIAARLDGRFAAVSKQVEGGPTHYLYDLAWPVE